MQGYLRPSRNAQKWNDQKLKLLQQFNELTDKDLQFEAGRKFEMIERISEKLGMSEEAMNHVFKTL
ncbi:MAG: general stress protein CsbD [Tenuifilaceae bacterium]